MNNQLKPSERAHLERIKAMACSCCGLDGPSEAHHIVQHQQYTTIPLCKSCHSSALNGWHGQKRIWAVLRKDEMICLNDTVRRLMQQNKVVT